MKQFLSYAMWKRAYAILGLFRGRAYRRLHGEFCQPKPRDMSHTVGYAYPPVAHRKIRCLPELLASYRAKITNLFAILSPGNVDGCSVAWGLSVTLEIPADIRISEGAQ